MTNARRILATIACATLTVLACTTPPATGPTATGGGGSPATVDTSRLIVAVDDIGAMNWNPFLASDAEEMVFMATKDTLIRTNPDTLELEPGLAESWSNTPDGKTWTFKLRPNVQFHGGYGQLTAEDVKFTWGLMIQEDSIHNIKEFYSQAVDENMDNFEIVSPLEFRLHTTTPVYYLPITLTNSLPGLLIESKKYWTEKPDQAPKHPLGTGPFEFVSATQGVEVQLKAVQDHWRQTPAFQNVTMKIIKDEAARLAQLRTGDVDLGALGPGLVEEARSAGLAYIPVEDVGMNTIYFGGMYYRCETEKNDKDSPWIQASAPEKGQAVREAMSIAIDRKALVDRVLYGLGDLTPAPFVGYTKMKSVVDPSWQIPAHDPARAKQLLAEGGYPNGFPVKMWVYDDFGNTRVAAEAIAGMWEAIGLQVERVPADYGQNIRPVGRAKCDPPSNNGYVWIHANSFYLEATQAIGTNSSYVANSQLWQHPSVDAAYDKTKTEATKAGRDAAIKEMLKALIDDVAAIPLYSVHVAAFHGKKVGSWSPAPGLDLVVSNLESVRPPQ